MAPVPGGNGRARATTWLWWLMVAAGVAAASGAGMLWRRHAEREQLRASLPALPDVSIQPAALGAALRGAEQKALSARQSLEGVGELARLYHANGYYKEADACWRILHAKQPREAHWCYYLADLRRMAGDDTGMVLFLEQTMKLSPDYAPAWLELAEWEFKTGRLDAAERDYRRRLALLPGDPYASLGLARVALQRDRRDEGRRLIEQLVREVPAFASAHNLYAEMLAEEGDADGANMQRYLSRLAGRFREADDPWLEELQAWCYDPSRLAMLASIEDMTNHGDHGVALLERAMRIAPDDARGYDDLGRVYLHVGDAAKALTLFEQGIKLPNASAGLYAGFSQAYLALNQPEKAAQAAEQGLALMPDAPELQTARGIALQAAGRLEEAVGTFRLVVKFAPNVCEAHYNLGSALLQLGHKEEAYVSLKRALELEPTFPKALIVLGQFELKAGRLDSAAQYLRPLYKFYPGSVSARRLMTWWCLQNGMAAARAGHMDEAERNLREGLEINPDMPELRGRLGLLYAQEGRFAEGRDQLETYHRLQPTEPMASLFLGQVYAHLGRTDDARRLLSEGEQLARHSGDKATEEQCAQALRQLPQ
jgi:tetratricopeptide (TPR) repeat protein